MKFTVVLLLVVILGVSTTAAQTTEPRRALAAVRIPAGTTVRIDGVLDEDV